jgi:Eukaryotic aspartyl protease
MMMMARAEDGSALGEVAAENVDEDVYYLCPVYIGEGDAKQKVMLDFDTGSADLWGISPFA